VSGGASAGSGDGHRNTFYNLRIDGKFTACGLFDFAAETNVFYHPRVLVSDGTPVAVCLTDAGTYYNGSTFTAPTLPNVNASDPPDGGDSTTNCHFFAPWLGNTSTAAAGGVAVLQVIGGGRHTFHGFFGNVEDTALRVIQFRRDSGSGGSTVNKIAIFGYNPHTPNDVGIEVATTVNGLIVIGDSLTATGATTADLDVITGGVLIDSNIELEKIRLQASATGYNQFRAGTSFEATGICEGTLMLSGSATVSLTASAASRRLSIFDTASGKRYHARDERTFSDTSTSGTGEDNLKTYSITGTTAFMGASGRKLTYKAAGTKTGAAGNKTIKFHLGASNWTVFPAANDELAWAFEADIYSTASNAQQLFLRFYQNGALTYAAPATAAIDLTSTTTMKLTGECANAADVITQTAQIVTYE